MTSRILLPGLRFWCHQTHLIDPDAVGHINGSRDRSEFQIGISLDEHYALGARLENLFQPGPEVGFRHRVLVDLDGVILFNHDHHGADRKDLVWSSGAAAGAPGPPAHGVSAV